MKFIHFSLALILFLFLNSCKKEKTPENNNGHSQLHLYLTDAPSEYDAVLIDIKEVEFIVDGKEPIIYPIINPGIYDLLRLRNGIDTLLFHSSLPAGKLSQIRLILGEQNSVVVNGKSYKLQTPSAQQSGLKINVHENLLNGVAYKLWLDFDAGKSIVEKGNGDYLLKPVIRSYTTLTNGMLKGIVMPLHSQPVVHAILGTDTIIALPTIDGSFQFNGLKEGNYNLWIDGNEALLFGDAYLQNISVEFGKINDIGIVTLPPL